MAVDGLAEIQKLRISSALAAVGSVHFAAEPTSDWRAALNGIDIVFGWPPPEALAQSEVCFHQLPSSGYDRYLARRDMFHSSFVLANARGVCARAVAEHGLAMMLAFVRRIPIHLRQQSQHVWCRESRYERLYGATLCIAGMGAIGQALQAMAAALGMCVIAVTRAGGVLPGVDRTYAFADLHQALARADHTVIVLPALPEDHILMGAQEFSAMKEGSYLYSLGRGSHLDYAALREALRSGHLAGAGLDVFAEEPLPSADPLWDEPNVLISPHAAGRFAGEIDDLIALFIDNTLRFTQGTALPNVVMGPERQ